MIRLCKVIPKRAYEDTGDEPDILLHVHQLLPWHLEREGIREEQLNPAEKKLERQLNEWMGAHLQTRILDFVRQSLGRKQLASSSSSLSPLASASSLPSATENSQV